MNARANLERRIGKAKKSAGTVALVMKESYNPYEVCWILLNAHFRPSLECSSEALPYTLHISNLQRRSKLTLVEVSSDAVIACSIW